MIKIITKSTLAMFVLLAVAGAASAAPSDITDWTKIDGVNAVTPTNILSTGGKFSYKSKKSSKGKMKVKTSYQAKSGSKGSKKGSKGSITLNDVGELGNSVQIYKAEVKVKKGKITIKGIDPFGTSDKKVTLVTARFNETDGVIALKDTELDTSLGGPLTVGYDLYGVSTFDIDCPQVTWNFCTTMESFYVAGDFKGKDKKGKISYKAKDATAVTTIPVPAAVWLFGSGLIGLVGIARRRKYS